MIGRFFNDLLTGVSNQYFEISRVATLLGVFAFVGYSGWHLYLNHAFDAMAFGTGFGAILLGSGVGTAAKDRANPANQPAPAPTIVAGDQNVTTTGAINTGDKP